MLYLLEMPDGTQWIGDGAALYELAGMPRFTTDSFLVMAGESADDKEYWVIKDEEFPLEEINVSMEQENERQTAPAKWNLQFLDSVLRPITDPRDGETLWLNEKYIKPFQDAEEIRYIIRRNQEIDGKYIVVFSGMFPIAVLSPCKLKQEIVDNYTQLLRTTKAVEE